MRGGDELDAALGDRARRRSLELGADLVDHDDLGHVVLDRLDHHGVLHARRRDLHAARATDAGMRDVAVTRDLVGGVDDDHTLAEIVRQHPGDLAEERGLADARPTEQQDAFPRLHDVANDLHGPVHRASDPQGEAHDLAGAVPKGADPMERPFDARPVVAAELADARDDVGEIFGGHFAMRQLLLATAEARLGDPSEVHDDLEQTDEVAERADPLAEVGRKGIEDRVKVVALDRHLTTAGANAGSSMRTASSLTKSIAVAISRKPSDRSARATCSS